MTLGMPLRCTLLLLLMAGTAAGHTQTTPPVVPDWALPGSATHKQVPPPPGFHRPTRTVNTPLGIFEGQSDIGGPLVEGSSSFDAATGQYTIRSAGYNIWYNRDEFRFVWKKMSGDVSLAADVSFPNPSGEVGDRKVVLVIRQSLDDDAKEAVVAEHGTGMVHLAERDERDGNMHDMQFRFGGSLYASLEGEPIHPLGPPVHLQFDSPFYVGIGFCPHLAATLDTGAFTNVLLENAAGKVR